MTWTKLGDEFGDECWTLTDKAFRLHTEGLCWSNRMLTDGKLAKDEMRRWAHHPDSAEELVSVGWWKDHGSHYQIVHHIGYQRTKKQIANESIANQKNAARRWRNKPSQDDSRNDLQCDSHSDSACDMDRTGQAGTREREKQENDEVYADDLRAWCTEDEPAESYTPTADQLRRIDQNVRAGYE